MTKRRRDPPVDLWVEDRLAHFNEWYSAGFLAGVFGYQIERGGLPSAETSEYMCGLLDGNTVRRAESDPSQ